MIAFAVIIGLVIVALWYLLAGRLGPGPGPVPPPGPEQFAAAAIDFTR